MVTLDDINRNVSPMIWWTFPRGYDREYHRKEGRGLTDEEKQFIEQTVDRVIREYGPALKRLAQE